MLKDLFRIGIAYALLQSVAVAAGPTTPTPPPRVCLNNSQCVDSVNPAPPPTASGSVKWHPGHYMASNTVLQYPGASTMSRVQGEMDDLNNQDSVLGYRVYVTWGAIETGQGVYDFSLLDAMLTRLTTAYNKPKRMVIYVWLYGQQGIKTNDGRVLPVYMQQDSAYGNSPVSGSYGWWGATTNGAPSGMYAPALYYQPVMDRLIALVQALGAHYDGNPNVEAIEFQENATIAQAASAFSPADSHYSDSAWLVQQQRLLSASVAAFPHTSVIMDNSWFDRPPPAVTLTQWMAANRVAQGTADIWGQSGINANGTAYLSEGIQTLLGVNTTGTATDLRSKMPRMMAIEGMELAGHYFGKYGGPWTPADMVNALNQTYYAFSRLLDASERGSEVFSGRRNRSGRREMEQPRRDGFRDAPDSHRVSLRLSLDGAATRRRDARVSAG